jgi:isoleucyl-tRNA synthetase
MLREQVLPDLESARQNKFIGKSLEAKVTLAVPGEFAAALAAREDVRELLNVSQLFMEPSRGAKLMCTVMRADGEKCERCWRWELDVGKTPEHPTICGRCVEAVGQASPGLR